jgi:hypothetical protein
MSQISNIDAVIALRVALPNRALLGYTKVLADYWLRVSGRRATVRANLGIPAAGIKIGQPRLKRTLTTEY